MLIPHPSMQILYLLIESMLEVHGHNTPRMTLAVDETTTLNELQITVIALYSKKIYQSTGLGSSIFEGQKGQVNETTDNGIHFFLVF